MASNDGDEDNQGSLENISLFEKWDLVIDEIYDSWCCWILVYEVLIAQEDDGEYHKVLPGCLGLIIEGESKYVKKGDEVKHAQLHIKSHDFDFHNVSDLELRVAAEVAVGDIVQVIVICWFLHDLLQALDSLEDFLFASMIGMVHFQRLSE